MIRPANTIERVLVYSKPIDSRKAVDGLSVIVEEALEENPFSDTLFVFTNRQRDNVKILCWERNGFVM
jgi:transposase